MQKAHENMLKLEEDIYEKGCRLETLEEENERFQNVIINIFQLFIHFRFVFCFVDY
jgi:hypothetical protein